MDMNRRILTAAIVACVAGLALSGSAYATSAAEWYAGVVNAADLLVEYQNDDGGWQWTITNPDSSTQNFAVTSPQNTLGCTARGLLAAYQVSGDAQYLAAANLTAVRMQDWILNGRAGSAWTVYNKDVEFAFELRAAGGIDVTADAVASAKGYIDDKVVTYGGTGAAAVHARYWSLPASYNGMCAWMLGEWVHVGRLIGAEEIYPGYTGDQFADELALLVAADYGTNFDPSGAYGILGIVGTLEGSFWGTGDAGTTSALADLKTLMDAGSGFGYQSLGYSTYILGLLGEDAYAKLGTSTLLSWQDAEGFWTYADYPVVGTDTWYTESHAEALLGVANNPVPEPMTMLAVGSAIAGLGGYIRRRRRA